MVVLPEALEENREAVNFALCVGAGRLPGGDTLARLLARCPQVCNRASLPPLTIQEILAWADDHRRRTGCWPSAESGTVQAAPTENWHAVDESLREGFRGLPGGTSLAQLLAKRRRASHSGARPPLTVEKILAWADAHHKWTGRWPTKYPGAVAKARGETWKGIDWALLRGHRGLSRGVCLNQLLREHRGIEPRGPARNRADARA